MPDLPSAELRRRSAGAAAGWPNLRLSGRGDAPLCRRGADKQWRHGKHHEGVVARRTGGDGALHIRPVIGVIRHRTSEHIGRTPPVDTLAILRKTVKLIGEDIRAK